MSNCKKSFGRYYPDVPCQRFGSRANEKLMQLGAGGSLGKMRCCQRTQKQTLLLVSQGLSLYQDLLSVVAKTRSWPSHLEKQIKTGTSEFGHVFRQLRPVMSQGLADDVDVLVVVV